MDRLERFFDELHQRARAMGALRRLAIISRLLLAMAFIPTGMVKVLGHRFTTMPITTEVGFFFEAMYRSGWYWNFIGWGQVIAGVLLLIPRTNTLGAMLFLPIIANVTALTWSIGFNGTIYITALMLLANLFLVCWDYDRWRGILFEPNPRPAVLPAPALPTVERAGYVLGAVAGLTLLFGTRSIGIPGMLPAMLALGGVAALMVMTGWVQAARARS